MVAVIKTVGEPAVQSTPSDLFDYPELGSQGELHFKFDQATGLRAIVAIHNTQRGPALGGCRCMQYSSFENAVHDALRLAKGMSYKAAMAKLPFGGGKAVLMQPAKIADRAQYFESFGHFVNTFKGRFLTGEDVGTSMADTDSIGSVSPYVLGTSTSSGDPSPYTALGVRCGIEAAVEHRLRRTDLDGIRVAIQGLGKVGFALAQELAQHGAQLIVSDINNELSERCADEWHAQPVSAEEIYSVDCDVFAPCALGAVINEQTVAQLRATIIAGSANNQLAEDYYADILHRRNILYAPDYVINAGGLICLALYHQQVVHEQMVNQVRAIRETLLDVFQRAEHDNCASATIADALASNTLASDTLAKFQLGSHSVNQSSN